MKPWGAQGHSPGLPEERGVGAIAVERNPEGKWDERAVSRLEERSRVYSMVKELRKTVLRLSSVTSYL